MKPASSNPQFQRSPDHLAEWHDRLQDWLDGELRDEDSAAFEAHLKSCDECQQALEALEQLDVALIEATPPMRLGGDFDQALFARIDAIDETKRAEARRRVEQEWQEQLHALSRNWKRTLAFMIPGVVGGIAVVMALTSWMDSSGLTSNLVAQGSAELGRGSASWLQMGIPTVIGAALGALVAPWLARLAE